MCTLFPPFLPSGQHQRPPRVSPRVHVRRRVADADGADHGRVEKQEGRLQRRGGQALLEGHLHFHKGTKDES